MSFSSDVKKMITSQEFDTSTGLAILSGIVKSCGVLLISKNEISFRIDDENNFTMQFLLKIIKKLYGLKPQIYVNATNSFGVNQSFSMHVEQAGRILADCGVLDEEFNLIFENRIPKSFLDDGKRLRAFMKGIFLGCGSVNDPENSYHMEIVLNSGTLSADIIEVLKGFEITAKHIYRRDANVVYFKDSASILDMLYLFEVNAEAFKYQDVLLLKEFRNTANRMRNCDTGNLNRLLAASYRQIDAINLIIKSVGVQGIPEGLREIALLRLDNPESDLTSLGMMMSKPISKSTVNSKLKKLEEISNAYK